MHPERVMARAQERYVEIKTACGETPKEIPSAQIRALCEALCEAQNEELAALRENIRAIVGLC